MRTKKAGKWMTGYLVCRGRGGSWERLMNMCRHHGIELWKIKREDSTVFCIRQNEFKQMIPLVKKTGVKLHICRKYGFPFVLQTIRKEGTFFSGICVFLALLFYFSTFVWEISYSGQKTYSCETLQKTVESMHVYTGMKRRNLDCDAIEKQIRQVHPDISWVSAEEKGSLLQISIREGSKANDHKIQTEPCHLVAKQDGVVRRITANRGMVMAKPGQEVKKGDILISGLVPITDDSEEVIENVAVAARGEVSILVEEKMKTRIPVKKQVKEYTGKEVVKYGGSVGRLSFSLKNPCKRLDNSAKYDILTTVCFDRLVHPLSLSVYLKKTEYREYRWKEVLCTEKDVKEEGMRLYQKLLVSQDGKEREIVDKDAVIKKINSQEWLLWAAVSYISHDVGTKAVTEEEKEIKKADGGQDGKSGKNS